MLPLKIKDYMDAYETSTQNNVATSNDLYWYPVGTLLLLSCGTLRSNTLKRFSIVFLLNKFEFWWIILLHSLAHSKIHSRLPSIYLYDTGFHRSSISLTKHMAWLKTFVTAIVVPRMTLHLTRTQVLSYIVGAIVKSAFN